MVPFATSSLSQKYLKSRCFILPWCSEFFATASADWLSMHRGEGLDEQFSPSSVNSFLSQLISAPAETAEMYSASVVDNATTDCNLELHEMAPVSTFPPQTPV